LHGDRSQGPSPQRGVLGSLSGLARGVSAVVLVRRI